LRAEEIARQGAYRGRFWRHLDGIVRLYVLKSIYKREGTAMIEVRWVVK
jgi:hypothetical protein